MQENYSEEQELIELNNRIAQAEKEGHKPEKKDILRMLEVLQQALNNFLDEMQKQGRSRREPEVSDVEVHQYAVMKFFAQKINLPTEKYDEEIKASRIRVWGEENYENFFRSDE